MGAHDDLYGNVGIAATTIVLGDEDDGFLSSLKATQSHSLDVCTFIGIKWHGFTPVLGQWISRFYVDLQF